MFCKSMTWLQNWLSTTYLQPWISSDSAASWCDKFTRLKASRSGLNYFDDGIYVIGLWSIPQHGCAIEEALYGVGAMIGNHFYRRIQWTFHYLHPPWISPDSGTSCCDMLMGLRASRSGLDYWDDGIYVIGLWRISQYGCGIKEVLLGMGTVIGNELN